MNATELIEEKGRAYNTCGGKYCTLQVYTTEFADVQKLINAFGGNAYPHAEGWQWVLSRKGALNKVRAAIRNTPSRYMQNRLSALFALPVIENFSQAAFS